MNAFPEFIASALTFQVTGAGVVIDPATGVATIPAEALSPGVAVAVSARDPEGGVTGTFRATLAGTAAPAVAAPVMTAAPALLGSGVIGAPVTLDPGVWTVPRASLALRWHRDGVAIPGATAAVYLPEAADDRTALGCAVTASNAAGTLVAVTEPLGVRFAAPVAAGGLGDLAVRLGDAAPVVDAAADFTGAALVFAVAGPGAAIDAASGALRLATDAPRTAATITVSAANSGGVATSSFRLSVAAGINPPPPPLPLGTIPDVVHACDSGEQSVSAQAGFSGEALVYTLEAAPAGVTIHAGSGLVIIATTAPIPRATVTVRARNSAGSATQSFAVTVRSTVSVFAAAGGLGDLGFVFDAAPAWSQVTGAGRLIPAVTGRAHGRWSGAAGDGRYRCLARWSSANATTAECVPFVLGARIARSGGNFTGVYVEALRPLTGTKRLRIQQYTGTGAATAMLASVARSWSWSLWYWVEIEIDGALIKARLYPEADIAPDWQVQATTTVPATSATAAGGFGPAGFAANGVSPTVLIKRLEFHPLQARIPAVPAAAGDADWTLGQVSE